MKYLTKLGILISGLAGIVACESANSGGATAGCKNDSECKGDRICLKGECVSGEGNPSKDTYQPQKDTYITSEDTYQPQKDTLEEIASEKCDPYTFQNQCDDPAVLTYCDVATKQLKSMDCTEQGLGNTAHCGYVEIVGNSICYGDGKIGDPCPSETQIYGDPELLKSECDYNIVDVCTTDYCTINCQDSSECPEGYTCDLSSSGYICIQEK